MRILFVSPRHCWPTLSGAKLRDYYLAKSLGENAELTYVHFVEPGLSPLTQKELPFCRQVLSVAKPTTYSASQVLAGLLGHWPLPVLNYTSSEMTETLTRLVDAERFDVVHLDSLHMAACLEGAMAMARLTPPVVYDWHNIESEAMRRYADATRSPARRFYAALTARKLESLERSILSTAHGHVVCSERERRRLLDRAPSAHIAVVGNGVDASSFLVPDTRPAGKRIVFVGLMNYRPNVDAVVTFAREVWPKLRKQLPQYSLTLVGADPVHEVLALREEAGVEVTGTVPDVRPYYHDALASIVPLRTGGGTRLKILEAMAAGVPVVSTPIGAEGLLVEHGRNILLADPDDSNEWLQALKSVADDGPRRQQLTAAARDLVRGHYDWTVVGRSLWQAYQDWFGAIA